MRWILIEAVALLPVSVAVGLSSASFWQMVAILMAAAWLREVSRWTD